MAATFAVCLLFLGTCLANVLRREDVNFRCSEFCTQREENGYSFSPGYSYVYQLDTKVAVRLQGIESQESWIRIRGQAEIQSISHCNLILRLTKISIRDSEPNRNVPALESREFQRALEVNPLAFGLNNGQITGLCPAENEAPWILNIKRGIISAIQNSVDSIKHSGRTSEIYERDVVGRCLTKYTVRHSRSRKGDTVHVTKQKDLRSCTERASYYGSIQSVPYSTNRASAQSLPLLKSSYQCDQSFNRNGQLLEVSCNEVQLFKPFSQGGNGAASVSTLKLNFQKAVRTSLNFQRGSFHRSSIVYEAPEEALREAEAGRIALNDLLALCTTDKIEKNTPAIFAHLVKTLKTVTNLERFYQRSMEKCPIARSIISDALPLIHTASGYRMMKNFIRQGHVTPLRAKIWYHEMAFTSNPDRHMISELLDLIGANEKSAVLGASAVVSRYCVQNPDCYDHDQVREIIQKLESGLGDRCKITRQIEDRALLILKALGNIGQFNPVLISLCVKEQSNSMTIRLAAIEAFRRVPCHVERRELEEIALLSEEALEIQVAAYLEVVRCPNERIVRHLNHFLRTQPASSKIGIFIYEHLKFSRRDSKLGELVSNHILPHHFLSHNIPHLTKYRHFSKNWPSVDTGVHGDAYAVFGDSYLPSKAMLNITVDMLGNSVNLFEVGGHARGLESLVESTLPPEVVNIMKNSKSQHKRRAPVKAHSPEGVAYVKLFGNEMGYMKFDEVPTYGRRGGSTNNRESLIEYLAMDKEFDWHKNVVFLDSSITVPTVGGLPLKLSVNGTASVMLKMKGKADMRQILRRTGELDINGYIRPSASVQIEAMMTVDAFHSISGLKFTTSLHQSTNLDGKVELRRGQDLKVRWNVPEERMDFMNLETNLITIHRHSRNKEPGLPTRVEKQRCSSSGVSKYLGFEICGEVSYPSSNSMSNVPHFPLSGPVSASFYWRKTDEKLTHYIVEAKYDNLRDRKSVHILLDTPGTVRNRKINVEVDLNLPAKEAVLQLETPIKKLSVTGKYEWNLMRRMALIELSSDGAVYNLLMKLEHDGKKTYSPTFRVTSSNNPLVVLDGSLISDDSTLSSNLALRGLSSTPLTLKGTWKRVQERGSFRYSVDLLHENPQFQLSTKASVVQSRIANDHQTSFDINYKPKRGAAQRAKFTGKIENSENQDIVATGEIENSFMPELNGFAEGRYFSGCRNVRSRTNRDCSLETSLAIGPNKNNKAVETLLYYRPLSNADKTQWECGGELKYPSKQVQYAMKISHLYRRMQELHSRIEVARAESTLGSAWLKLAQDPGDKIKMSGDVGFRTSGMWQHLKVSLNELAPKHYDFLLTLDDSKNPGRDDFKISGQYKDMTNMATGIGKYEISGRIQSAAIEVSSIKGKLEARRHYLDVAVKGQKGNQKLSADARYIFSDREHKFKAQCKYSSHFAKLHGHWKNTADVFDALVSSDLDSKYKLHAHGKLENQKAGRLILGVQKYTEYYGVRLDGGQEKQGLYQMSGKVRYPGQIIEAGFNTTKSGPRFSGSYMTDARIQWLPSSVIQMKVNHELSSNFKSHFSLQTPFYFLTQVDVNVFHKADHSQGNVLVISNGKNYETKWAGKQYVQNGWSNIEGKILAKLPWSGFERGSLIFSAGKSDREIRSEIKLHHGQKELRLVATGERARTNPANILNGGLTLYTPYAGYEEVGLLVSHRYSEQGVNSDLAFKLGAQKTATVHLEGRHLINRVERIVEAAFKVECPYSSKRWAFELKHKLTNSQWQCSVKAQRGTEFANAVMNSNHRISSAQADFNGELKISTSHPEIKDVLVKVKHNHEPFTYNTDVSIAKNSKPYALLKSLGRVQPNRRDPLAVGLLELDLPGGRKLKSEMDSFIRSNADTSQIKFRFANVFSHHRTLYNATVNLDTKLRPNELDGTFQLVTPTETGFKNVEMRAAAKWLAEDPLLVNINVKWHPGKEAWFQQRIVFNGYEHVRMVIRASTPYNQRVNIEMDHSMRWAEHLTCKAMAETYVEDKGTRRNHRKYEAISRFAVTENPDGFASEFTLRAPGFSAGIISTLIDRDGRAIENSVEAYLNSKAFKTESKFERAGERSFGVSLIVTTPFQSFERSEFRGKVSLDDLSQSRIEAQLKVGEHHNKLTTEWLYRNHKWQGTTKIEILKSGRPDVNVVAQSSGQHSPGKASGDISLEWGQSSNAKEVKLTFNGNYESLENMEGGMTLNTPIDEFRQLGLVGSIKPSKDGRTASFEVTKNSQKIALTASFVTGDRNSVFARLQTPFENFEDVSLTCAYDQQPNRRHSVVCAYKPADNREIQATVEGGYDDHSIDGFVRFKTPFQGWEGVSLQGNTRNQVGLKRIDLKLGWGTNENEEQQITFLGEIKNPADLSGDVKLVLRTPFEPVQHWYFHSKGLINPVNKYEVNGDLEFKWTETKRVRILLNSKIDFYKEAEVSLRLFTPLEAFRDQQILIRAQQNPQSQITGTVEVRWAERVQIKGDMQVTAANLQEWEGDLKIESPFQNFEERQIWIRSKYEPGKVYAGRLEVKDTGRKTFAIELNHMLTYAEKKFGGHMKLYYPVGLHSTSTIEYNVRYPMGSFSNKIKWTANNRQIADFQVEFGNNGKLFDLYADNIWYPFEAKYLLSPTKEGQQLESTLCWNLRQHQDSTVHLKTTLTEMAQSTVMRKGLSATLALPSRTVAFSCTKLAGHRWHQSCEVTWDVTNQRKAGYELVWSQAPAHEMGLKLWNPLRTVEMKGKHETGTRKSNTEVLVKYDASRPDGYFKFITEYDGAHRNHKVKSTFQHPRLNHDIISKFEIATNPLTIRSELVYSGDINKKLSASLSVLPNLHNRVTVTVRHPASHLDLDVRGSVFLPTHPTDDDNVMFSSMFSVTSNTNRMGLKVRSTATVPLQIEVMSPRGSTTTIDLRCANCKCELFMGKDGRNTSLAEVGTSRGGFLARMNIRPFEYSNYANMYKIEGKSNRRGVGIEAMNQLRGVSTVDLEFKAKLEGLHLLKTKVVVRPNMLEEFKETLSHLVEEARRRLETISELSEDGVMLAGYKTGEIWESLYQELDVLENELNRQIQLANRDIETIARNANSAYDADAFYIKSVLEPLKPLGSKISEKTKHYYGKIYPKIVIYKSRATQTVGTMWRGAVETVSDNVKEPAGYALTMTTEAVGRGFYYGIVFGKAACLTVLEGTRIISRSWDLFKSRFGETLDEILDNIEGYFVDIFQYYMNHPHVRYIVRKVELVHDNFEDVVHTVDRSFSEVHRVIIRNAPWLEDNVIFRTLEDYWNGVKAQMAWAWHYWGIRYQLKETFWRMYRDAADRVLSSLKKLASKYTGYRDTKITYYNAREGRVEAQIWIPFPVHTMNQVPDYREWEEYHQLQGLYHKTNRYYKYYLQKFHRRNPNPEGNRSQKSAVKMLDKN